MSGHGHDMPMPVKGKFFTPGTIGLLAVMAVGLVCAVWRYAVGLEATTNLTDIFPWGIYKAVNVAAIAALGSSGFTMTFIVHVLHKEKYHALMRPALIVGVLCYTFVGIALMVDIGKYYDIWHPFLPSMWQVNSALFEVAMCVMSYLTVLYIEFAPIFFQRFIGKVNLKGKLWTLGKMFDTLMRLGDAVVAKIMGAFMVLGIVLCCMHQNTLGTIMVITGPKMHGLWYTPALLLLFLASAVAVGLTSAVVASLWSSKAFGTKYEMDALTPLARSLPIFIGIYIAIRLIDLALRGTLGLMFEGSTRSYIFLVEFFIGICLPCVMTMFESVRKSPRLLFAASFIFILGITMNRIDTYLVSQMPMNAVGFYFPSFAEIVICLSQVAAIIVIFRIIAFIFPIISQPPEAAQSEPAKAAA
jgi:Ni/Fe-hydrogenase subunit HybB-like protein